MHVTFDSLKTFYNILTQKLKNYRGNWEQNDPSADDYIKNRPFYSDTKKTTIFDNFTKEEYENDDVSNPKCNFIVGNAYDVVWNGILYENLICHLEDGCNVIGNKEHPFYIDDDGGNALYIEDVEGNDWSASIYSISEVVHQIDKKYVPIPDGITTENDVHNIVDEQLNNFAETYTSNAVRFDEYQSLTDAQKSTARENIGAGTSNFSGSYADLTGIPSQVQADWNISDNTQPGYIIGKTHYEEPFSIYLVNNKILSPTSVQATSGKTVSYACTMSDIIDVADEYITKRTSIHFSISSTTSSKPLYSIEEHVRYSNSFADSQGRFYEYYSVGNQSILGKIPIFAIDLGSNENSGEEYAIVIEKYKHSDGTMIDGYPKVYIVSNRSWSTTMDFTVSVINKRVVPLDEKYIPDTIARTSDVADQIAEAIRDKEHANDGSQLYDTVTDSESIDINAAMPQCPIEVVLSSEVYTDLSQITVVLNGDSGTQQATSDADGVVAGLNSESSFTLSLQSDMTNFDPSQVTISCTYQLDLNRVLHDYVLHVDLEGGEDSDGIDDTIIVDDTLSISGAAADARATGNAISSLNTVVATKIDTPEFVEVGQVLSVKSIDDHGNIVWETINQEVADGNVITDPTLSIEGGAADAKVTGDRLTTIESQIAELLYDEISITSFIIKNNTAREKGVELKTITFEWVTNKEPTTLSLNGVSLDPTSYTTTLTDLSITGNTTWTLTATDERDHTATDTVSVHFYNGVYYGTATEQTAYDSNFIMSLSNKTLTSNIVTQFTATANDGLYVYYCLPVSMGECVFNVGGFDGGVRLVDDILFTNGSGHSENYYIYRTVNSGIGTKTFKISKKVG